MRKLLGYSPIVKALVNVCGGEVDSWPYVLPYALWVEGKFCDDVHVG